MSFELYKGLFTLCYMLLFIGVTGGLGWLALKKWQPKLFELEDEK